MNTALLSASPSSQTDDDAPESARPEHVEPQAVEAAADDLPADSEAADADSEVAESNVADSNVAESEVVGGAAEVVVEDDAPPEPHLETAALLNDAPPACGAGEPPIPAVTPPAASSAPAKPQADVAPKQADVAPKKVELKKPEPQPEPKPEPAPKSGFAKLGLSAALLKALAEKGYETPTPVQAEVIPAILAGRDVLGQAATGTGKTAAFALPLLDRMRIAETAPDAPDERPGPAIFCMAPTRELAAQVAEAFRAYRGEMRVNILTVVGGESFGPQLSALRRGVDVVVATPGRALDLLKRGSLDLSGLLACVLDEADEMLDMGFQDEIEAVLDFTPPGRQTVLVSATLAPRIQAIAAKHLSNPVRIEIGKPQAAKGEDARVVHSAHFVRRQEKAAAIDRILEVDGAGPTLIFCRTRGGADDLTTELNRCGRRAAALHGGLTQDQRTKVVERLRGGTLNVVVATDVAARGLDVPELTHVVHADLPNGPEPFVHRCGRVGRAGRVGRVVSFLHPKERFKLVQFARAANADVAITDLPAADDVVTGRLKKTRAALQDAATSPAFAKLREQLGPLLAELDKEFGPETLALAAAALAHRTAFGEEPVGELGAPGPRDSGGPSDGPRGKGGPKFSGGPGGSKFKSGPKFAGKGAPRTPGPCPPGSARLWVSAGRDSGVRPGDLVGAIAGETHLSGGDIGAITIAPSFSLVDVPQQAADTVIQSLSRGGLRGDKVTVRHDRQA
ncbi:DEAD/DEAH box helicase [Alienimonas californiensis]|uniref:RNA helicase n=1 Tax=Alienimonas californiensis TaxID=2527989 RepID=A0A517P741_9PLAN|nr:DEAD/DEAH box helicase [Alienimonas californiensis]QDT15173.1 ATP-dependent RNA helicase DeaD [Alienimonas californiensis]